jgi:hypothetical protein
MNRKTSSLHSHALISSCAAVATLSRLSVIASALTLVVLTSSLTAGTFNVVPFTGDADSGVSAVNSYTHLLDFAGPGATVNGVPFVGAGQVGSNYGLANIPNTFNNSPNNGLVPAGDGFHTLFNDFYYGGAVTEQVMIRGLTPGVSYSARFYSTPWVLGDNRTQLVKSGPDTFTFNEDGNNVQYLEYIYTATENYKLINFSAANPGGGSMHQYAMSNQVSNVVPPPTLLQSIPGLYNTGVDNARNPLPNDPSAIDTHYALVVNPDSALTGDPNTHVQNETVFPIAGGPWVANTGTSKWVSPRFDSSAAAGTLTPPNYVYSTTFDLTGLNPVTASLSGQWATDNFGIEIRLNGQVIPGTANTTQFPAYTGFSIPIGSPFQAGVNTLEFVVQNADVQPPGGYTGLHVTNLQGTAVSTAQPVVTIPSLYNSGVDNSHVTLAPGSADPHYQIVAAADPNFAPPAPAVVQSNHPAWLANTPISSWISTVPDGTSNIAPGQYIFETSFDLTGFNSNSVVILGQFAADNSVDQVYLNGNLVPGIAGGGFTFWTPFTLNSGFIPGVNTLTFLFTNAPPGDNPGGFRLEMNGFAVVPEPATLALCTMGLAGLVVLGRRFRR